MKMNIKTKINTIQQNIHGINGLKVETFANVDDLIHAGNELIIQIKDNIDLKDDVANGIKLFNLFLEEIKNQTKELLDVH